MTVKQVVTFEQVKQAVEKLGWTLIAERPLTTHDGDWYLRVVHAFKDSAYGREYAVWLFNGTRDTLNEGNYSRVPEVSYEKFLNKK